MFLLPCLIGCSITLQIALLGDGGVGTVFFLKDVCVYVCVRVWGGRGGVKVPVMVVLVVTVAAVVVVLVAVVMVVVVVVVVVEVVVLLHVHGLGKSKFDKQKTWLLGFVTFTHSSIQNNMEHPVNCFITQNYTPMFSLAVDRTSHTPGPSLQHVERL